MVWVMHCWEQVFVRIKHSSLSRLQLRTLNWLLKSSEALCFIINTTYVYSSLRMGVKEGWRKHHPLLLRKQREVELSGEQREKRGKL